MHAAPQRGALAPEYTEVALFAPSAAGSELYACAPPVPSPSSASHLPATPFFSLSSTCARRRARELRGETRRDPVIPSFLFSRAFVPAPSPAANPSL